MSEANLEDILHKFHQEHTHGSSHILNVQITGQDAEKSLVMVQLVCQELAKYLYAFYATNKKEDARIFWQECHRLMHELFQDSFDEREIDQAIQQVSDSIKKSIEQATEQYLRHVDRMFQEEGVGNAIFQRIEERSDQLFRRWVEQINRVGNAIDKQCMYVGAVGVAGVAVAAVVYYAIKLQFNYFNRLLKRPLLITHTNYRSWWQKIKDSLWGIKKRSRVSTMIFSTESARYLNNIIESTKYTAEKIKKGNQNVTYRNILFYGKPGTGKTMFARQLANQSGMDFVIISGASFAKFIERGEGISMLDDLFAWADRSEKGLLIFIDEIDAFAYKRDLMSPEGFDLKTFNNFLHHVNGRSNRFMLVMATNRIELLDNALLDRIDELIYMPLPDKQQRIELLKHYRDTILCNEPNRQVDKSFNDAKIEEVALQTEGFSCRALESLIGAIKSDITMSSDSLSVDIIVNAAVRRSVEKFQIAILN